jgi:hypothetical protein
LSISFYISNLACILKSLICIVWFKIMTVNQRVLGSSPRGGASKKEASVYTGAFFVLRTSKGLVAFE